MSVLVPVFCQGWRLSLTESSFCPYIPPSIITFLAERHLLSPDSATNEKSNLAESGLNDLHSAMDAILYLAECLYLNSLSAKYKMEMIQECVGRVREKEIFEVAMKSNRAELLAITGRRRVGKTFLIHSVFSNRIDFELSGVRNAKQADQLQSFSYRLADFFESKVPLAKPSNWMEAFRQLSIMLDGKKTTRKKVVFIDELPWLATAKSGFMQALDFFWNSWAVNKQIVVVLCGSAASWMIRRLVHDKGGLHNRITHHIQLQPFTLHETRLYLESLKVFLEPYQTIQLYMVTGGIPHYLSGAIPGQSAMQIIDRLCFELQGILVDEFEKLYASLFAKPENHVRIVRALADKRKGLTRKQLLETAKMADGGSISRLLEELESSGFITSYFPFGKQKKEKLFRLTDEYSLFYLQFMEGKKSGGQGTWLKLSDSQAWKSWSGYAFENICLKHVQQIKKAMGVQGVYSEASSFFFAGNQERSGIQVDLLIDRRDHVINFCEMKFYDGPFTFTKAYAMEMRQKMTNFRELTGTRKQLALTMVTAFGLQQNEHSLGLVQNEIRMEALFAAE